jgi:flagellar biosynthesis/type III secretory pathway M-ring protein FliF/YscJ
VGNRAAIRSLSTHPNVQIGVTFTPRRQRRNNDQKEDDQKRRRQKQIKNDQLVLLLSVFILFITVTLFPSNRIHPRNRKAPAEAEAFPHPKT